MESTQQRLDALRDKLDRLTRSDPRRTLFGAGGHHGHRYQQVPPLSEAIVAGLEASHGVRYPAELRLFLTTVHGGGPGPGYGFHIRPDERPRPRRAQPFPFDEHTARTIITRRRDRSEPYAAVEMPEHPDDDDDDHPPGPGFIPVAHMGCGVFCVVVVTGSQRGLVWCCDTSWCPTFDAEGRHQTFLDWYESWLDISLAQVASTR